LDWGGLGAIGWSVNILFSSSFDGGASIRSILSTIDFLDESRSDWLTDTSDSASPLLCYSLLANMLEGLKMWHLGADGCVKYWFNCLKKIRLHLIKGCMIVFLYYCQVANF